MGLAFFLGSHSNTELDMQVRREALRKGKGKGQCGRSKRRKQWRETQHSNPESSRTAAASAPLEKLVCWKETGVRRKKDRRKRGKEWQGEKKEKEKKVCFVEFIFFKTLYGFKILFYPKGNSRIQVW